MKLAKTSIGQGSYLFLDHFQIFGIVYVSTCTILYILYKAKKFSVHTLQVKRWPIFHAKLLTSSVSDTSSVDSKFICIFTIEQ